MAKIRFWQTAINYWLDDRTNIFNNYIDAICGVAVIVGFPFVSLISVFFCTDTGWANYVFPIISMAGAGMYDTYGRWSVEKRRPKLVIRICFDAAAIILAALFAGSKHKLLWFVPPSLLLVCGIGLLFEAVERIKVAIEISEWSVLK